MEDKKTLVTNYITAACANFSKYGYPIPEDKVQEAINRYTNSTKSFAEIKEEIDELIQLKLEKIRRIEEFKNKMMTKSISDLPVDKGITLNMQQIDLLSIVEATDDTIDKVIANIQVLSEEQKLTIIDSNISIEKKKRELFRLYQEALISYEDTNYRKDGKRKELEQRSNFIIENANLTEEDKNKFIDIIKNNPKKEIPHLIAESFDKSVSDKIFEILIRYEPTEREGIKNATYEEFEKLSEHLSDYEVINLDSIPKYSRYVRADGSFNREDLIKAFDYARSLGKETRLNTLLFFMDMPDSLEDLTVEEGKEHAKQLLLNYVDNITTEIAEYNKACLARGEKTTVRTVEIFNELLNRFPMTGDNPYSYRGYIDTDEHRVERNNPNYENLRAGWLRFFEIEELCSIMETARKNLPDVNFMINECTLEDPRKVEAFKVLILDKIRAYEKEHNIKLIDSIGTQMHINSSVSKEEMKMMFEKLGQLGLPIEVTEFDMHFSKDFVDTHTKEEVEIAKRQKLDEFFDVIVEMQKQGNIAGVTIWSINDSQNSAINHENLKIYHENLKRKARGEEPLPYINNLYGGYYDSNMDDITKPKENTFNQNFNYHTHTYRSGHSAYVSDSEMLKAAKEEGITMVGFSEHAPNHPLLAPEEDRKMLLREVDEYISSINRLKEENPDMTILSGFEAEYDSTKELFLGQLRDRVDYMILGEHFIINGLEKTQTTNNPNYPLEYAEMVVKGIESGIFDIVAHPDTFMQKRDSMETEELKSEFDRNAIIASRMICEKARDMGIPIEINLAPAMHHEFLADGSLKYPHPLFWQEASKVEGLQVLKGVDAHYPGAFKRIPEAEQLITNIESMVSDKLITGSYNPQQARQNNPRLQEAYKRGQAESLSFETHMISQIVDMSLSTVDDNTSQDNLDAIINSTVDSYKERSKESASHKEENLTHEISEISRTEGISATEKRIKPERKKQAIIETKQALSNQQRVFELTKSSVAEAKSIGCESKTEYKKLVPVIAKQQTTKKKTEPPKVNSHNKPKVLTKTNNGNIDTIMLSLIIIFGISITIYFIYLICK